MEHIDRVYRLHRILKSRRTPIGVQSLRAELDCSRATLYRDIAFLRDRLGAPIESSERGYFYDREVDETYELPGLWFSSSELQTLLAIQNLLQGIDAGVLREALAPLERRVRALLRSKATGKENPVDRIRVVGIASRDAGKCFEICTDALLNRRRLSIEYLTRSTGVVTERTVSPQHMIRYRDNWYMDAWCHLKKALRTFALDCVESATLQDEAARDISERSLKQHYESSYGIFSGRPRSNAHLIFSSEQARWVSREQWHPKQKARYLEDGRYELQVPYSNPTELVMDVLRYGPNVEVASPLELRDAVHARLREAVSIYQ